MIGKRQPAIRHPHQDRFYLNLRLGFCQPEAVICLLREVQSVRHCNLPVGNFGTPAGTAMRGLLVARKGESM